MSSSPEMIGIALALASAVLLGTGVVITQFGLRYMPPMSGAAVSVPAFTVVFLLVSPLLLRGEHVVWEAVPIFIGVGLVFPSLLTTLTFLSNHALGPIVTSALGNLAPLFSVTIAVVVLFEPLHSVQAIGLVVALGGVLLVTLSRGTGAKNWRTWSLLLPIGASVLRGVVPPVLKVGLALWPSPVFAGLIAYCVSSLVVLISQRVRTGRFIDDAPTAGYVWFAAVGMANGLGTLLLYAAVAHGRVSLVTPLVATYPIVALLVSALVLPNSQITLKMAVGNVAAVLGVVLVILGR